jgi:CRP-like cAMP-binding protein
MSAHVPKPGDILRKAFPGIPRREAEEMVAIGEMKSYPAGIVLCREGVIEDTFYILLEGEVEVTKVINEEEARFLKYLLPGEFFGEMGLIHNAPRAATVSTTQPTTVLCINKPAFNNFLNLSPSVSMAMVREVSRRLRENDEMAIEDLQLKAG